MALSDPSAVMAAYHEVISGEFNWLLLYYTSESCDSLALDSYGSQGLEELKTRIHDLNEIFIAYYREEEEVVDPGFIILNYIPSHVSPMKRARALVHSRRVGGIFKKHQAILTLDNLSLLTSETVHQAITNPDCSTFTRHSTPDLLPPKSYSPEPTAPPPPLQPMRKVATPIQAVPSDKPRPSFTAIYAPEMKHTHNAPSKVPSHNLLSNFLRRKKKSDGEIADVGDSPPPPPPKDIRLKPIAAAYSNPIPMPAEPILRPRRSPSFSNYGAGRETREKVPSPYSKHQVSATETVIPTVTLTGKWAPVRVDAEERARRRREYQKQKEEEDKQSKIEEAQRQERLKQEREEFARNQWAEEEERKRAIEEEVQRVTVEKRRREQYEREQEEMKKREQEIRKKLEREKRAREHKEAEEWRRQQSLKQQEAERQAQEAKRRAEEERSRKFKQVEDGMKAIGKNAEHVGWITVSNGGVVWKRRFYRFIDDIIYLYRSPKEMEVYIDQVKLKGQVGGLKEWDEGYEDLEAIPFSFVVEFKNEKNPWYIYADNQEEKFKIMGLFQMSGK